MEIISFELSNPDHHTQAANLWSAACGEKYRINPNFVRYNTLPTLGCEQAGWFAVTNGQLAGFCLSSAVTANLDTSLGWIDALAVAPVFQQRGAGTALVHKAQDWLISKQRKRMRLGGSLRPFTPGLPADIDALDFFLKAGFVGSEDQPSEWDMAHDLQSYETIVSSDIDAEAHPVTEDEVPALLSFANSAFPGRWEFEVHQFFRDGGRSTDILMAWSGGTPVGFSWLTFEDSIRPLDRYYPQRLPRPWGQLGMVGVTAAARGRGFGLLVVDAGLLELKRRGVRGCVIDWTTLIDLYAKFGFSRYTQYTSLFKDL